MLTRRSISESEKELSPSGSHTRARIESIDLVRGLVIVFMALDHVHDFFGDLASQPTNLSTTTSALFFTRWITNFCAPAFFLLSGTSAFLMLQRKSKGQLAYFLLSRGVWLIFLELVVMRFALQFNFDYRLTVVTVLWALGWSMIALAGLIRLPTWVIAVVGAILIIGHNATDGVQAATFGAMAPIWRVMHVPGMLFDTGRHAVFVAYVLIPWIGVTMLGYVLGSVFLWKSSLRRTFLLSLGTLLCVSFALVRLLNVYGDPLPWSAQKNSLWTLLSFLDTNKYPPSLLFLLMTLGPVSLLLGVFEKNVPLWLRPVLTVGKVPLFFYVLHFFLIHLLAVAASWLRYGEISEMFRSPDISHFPFSQFPGWGASLPVIYLLWMAVLLIMFPLCRWYASVKQQRNDWWLSYV